MRSPWPPPRVRVRPFLSFQTRQKRFPPRRFLKLSLRQSSTSICPSVPARHRAQPAARAPSITRARALNVIGRWYARQRARALLPYLHDSALIGFPEENVVVFINNNDDVIYERSSILHRLIDRNSGDIYQTVNMDVNRWRVCTRIINSDCPM